MKQIKINDTKLDLPESINEFTFGDYVRVFDGVTHNKDTELTDIIRDEAKVFSRILKQEDDFCLKLTLEQYGELKEDLNWILDCKDVEAKDHIDIDGHSYYIKDIGKLSLENYITIDNIVNNVKIDKNGLPTWVEVLNMLLDKDVKISEETFLGLPAIDMLSLFRYFFAHGEAGRLTKELASQTDQLVTEITNLKEHAQNIQDS